MSNVYPLRPLNNIDAIQDVSSRIDQLIEFYTLDEVLDCWTKGTKYDTTRYLAGEFLLTHLKNVVRTYGLGYTKTVLESRALAQAKKARLRA